LRRSPWGWPTSMLRSATPPCWKRTWQWIHGTRWSGSTASTHREAPWSTHTCMAVGRPWSLRMTSTRSRGTSLLRGRWAHTTALVFYMTLMPALLVWSGHEIPRSLANLRYLSFSFLFIVLPPSRNDCPQFCWHFYELISLIILWRTWVRKVPNFISLESMKNIACVHCNLNKISHMEVFFWSTQNKLNRKKIFKMDSHFGTVWIWDVIRNITTGLGVHELLTKTTVWASFSIF